MTSKHTLTVSVQHSINQIWLLHHNLISHSLKHKLHVGYKWVWVLANGYAFAKLKHSTSTYFGPSIQYVPSASFFCPFHENISLYKK